MEGPMSPAKKRGFFITIEGIEGCGKTTQAMMLAQYLKKKGVKVLHTREPGGTDIGKRVRAVLLDPESKGITGLAELLLYSADRAQHLSEVVEPALKRGVTVLCDRFTDATVAYQGYGRGLDMEVIESLNGMATGGCYPDLTLLLDLPVEVGLGRAIGRNDKNGIYSEARFEMEAVKFHKKVRKGYLSIAACEPGRVKVIHAGGTVREVKDAVRAVVDEAMA
jgi:dTMP kinase